MVVEERGAYAVVTMNRPRSLNALSREVRGARVAPRWMGCEGGGA